MFNLWKWPLREWPEIVYVELKVFWLRRIWWGEEKFLAWCHEASYKRLMEALNKD